ARQGVGVIVQAAHDCQHALACLRAYRPRSVVEDVRYGSDRDAALPRHIANCSHFRYQSPRPTANGEAKPHYTGAWLPCKAVKTATHVGFVTGGWREEAPQGILGALF